jgi:AraC-like DNA-binding protein
MTTPMGEYLPLRLTTDPVPPPDRVAVTREVFGRHVLNLDLEPDPEQPLRVDFRMHALDGLKIVTGSASGVVSRRTPALLADSNDDLFLSLNETNDFYVRHRGIETVMGPGDAVLATCAEPIAFRRASGRAIGLCAPRAAFAHAIPSIEDFAGRLIPRHTEPLRLLKAYVNGLDTDEALTTPELRHLVSCHVQDLIMLAVDTEGAVLAGAARRGLKAARLRAIKGYVRARLTENLSVGTVAAAHGLTERYVQRLFEAEGVTFSSFVSRQRLARAHRLLRDPRAAGQAVSVIAYDCGFGDVTHFNRQFRRLYGQNPSEVRVAAKAPAYRAHIH